MIVVTKLDSILGVRRDPAADRRFPSDNMPRDRPELVAEAARILRDARFPVGLGGGERVYGVINHIEAPAGSTPWDRMIAAARCVTCTSILSSYATPVDACGARVALVHDAQPGRHREDVE